MSSVIGLVVIGRNEGERLVRCLRSVLGTAAAGGGAVVYVDSGSTDGSVAAARQLGATVVELDMSRPFTAARARNAGFEELARVCPGVRYVQFVDGDCEIVPGWLGRAAAELDARPDVAIVCGRLRERHRTASVYNRLCDIEWDRPAGEVTECGGIAMMRVGPFREAGGFDPGLIAGEEPELCLRLRGKGWKVVRLADDMGWHDAAMTRFGQWWKRSTRPGYSNYEGLATYGPDRGAHYLREIRSVWFWTAFIPLLVLVLAWPTHGWSLLLLAVYPLQASRIFLRHRRRLGTVDAAVYGAACVLGKLPQLQGQVRYHLLRARGRRAGLVDYKSPSSPGHQGTGEAPAVAYLINQYPQPTQSFIRREIAAVEQAGIRVSRFTLRRWDGELVDPADVAERQRTRSVLDASPLTIVAATVARLLTHPAAFVSAAGLAFRMARTADRGWFAHVAYLMEACLLERWLRGEGVRHVHAHFGTNSTAVAMLCHALGGPTYSATIHGSEEFERAPGLGLGEKVRRATFVAAISDFGRSQIYRWSHPADWAKVHVVRCCVDETFLTSEVPPASESPRVVSVGRLSAEKGHLLLIEAVARVNASGTPMELTIVGDGPLRAELDRAVERHGLRDRVRILGWQGGSRVREEILNSRALVQASFNEGLPVVIMEALALHRPVVSSSLAGIPELVRPGVNGWLVPPGSVDALAGALRDVARHTPAELRAMGDAGADAVGQMHRASQEATKLRRLFLQTLGSQEPAVSPAMARQDDVGGGPVVPAGTT